jgi:hypothetical protein
MADGTPGEGIGVLCADDRDVWAEVRQILHIKDCHRIKVLMTVPTSFNGLLTKQHSRCASS